MNNYSKLIDSHMISFKEALVKNFKKIGLNEIETMVIILLYEQKKKSSLLSINSIQDLVTLSEHELSNMIVDLVERDFIELIIEDNMEEHFTLTPTIEKLGEVLEKNEKPVTSIDVELSKIVTYIESVFQKQLVVSDLQVIERWVTEGFTFEQISNAVMDSLKARKMSVKYADAILVSRKEHKKATNIDPKLQEVLQQINVKRR